MSTEQVTGREQGGGWSQASEPLIFGQYRVLSVIGQGGMGTVYRAQHSVSGALVALKTTSVLDSITLVALRREISALRRFDHPRVVRILDDGLKDGVPWYAMELLDDRTFTNVNRDLWSSYESDWGDTSTPRPHEQAALEQALLNQPIGYRSFEPVPGKATTLGPRPAAAGHLQETLRLYLQLCEPLSYLHGLGVVHRDLSPRNVFVRTDRTPMLVDFGLWAQATGGIGREALEGGERGFGSVSYMAPERILGRAVDARADLYALGCMLYESMTGSPPFVSTDKSETLSRHLQQSPIAPSQRVSGLPVALDELILSLLAKAPEDRIGHAEDVASVLASLVGDALPRETVHPSVGYLYRPRLAGRHEVVAELLSHWEKAKNGASGITFIGGQSGVGKTSLVNEVVQRIAEGEGRRPRIVTGECRATSSEEKAGVAAGGAFHPLRTLLQAISDHCASSGSAAFDTILGERLAILGMYEPGLGQMAVARGAPVQSVLPSSAARDRILLAATETLRAFASIGPLLLVLDDLQWADDLTLSFLSQLQASFFQGLELLIIGTFRTEEATPQLQAAFANPAGRMVRLSPIDQRSVTHVIGDMLAMREPPNELVEFVQRESDGNPFLVAEYLRLMVSEQVLSRRGGRWVLDAQRVSTDSAHRSLPAPAAVHELVSRRLSRLSRPTRQLVGCAAVLGRYFEPSIVREVLEYEQTVVDDCLLEATLGEVIRLADAEKYAFTHDKIREAAYAGLLPIEARELHRKSALVIEARFSKTASFAAYFGDLAHHFGQAGERVLALGYLERAGEDALQRSANREAIAYLREALEYAAQLGEVESLRAARWLRLVGDALQGLGDLRESADYLSRAARALGVPVPEGALQYARALLPRLARQTAHRLFPDRYLGSRREDSERLLEAARVYDRLQQVFYYRGEPLPIIYAAVTTLNLSELASPSPELVHAYSNAHAVSGIMPAPALSVAFRKRALEAVRQVPDPASKTYFQLLAANLYAASADWSRGQDLFEDGQVIARQIGFRRRLEELTGAYAAMDYYRGKFTESMLSATAQFESALRGDSQTQCWGLLSRAQVFSVWDQPQEALREIAKAEPLLDTLGRTERAWASAEAALAALQCGRTGLAREKAALAAKEVLAGPTVAFYCVEAHGTAVEVWLSLAAQELAVGRAEMFRDKRTRALVRSLQQLARVFAIAGPRRFLYEGFYQQICGKREAALRSYRRSQERALTLGMPWDAARANAAIVKLASIESSQLGQASKEPFARPLQAVRPTPTRSSDRQ